ncbi:MAG: hypothetical protein AB1486_20845, partial [Planctomycetota bacterium]
LRFTGPLGLTGWPVELVNTLEFSPAEDGKTRVKLTCRAAGAMQKGWPAAVDRTWRHFLVEQFKPYVDAGKHRGR